MWDFRARDFSPINDRIFHFRSGGLALPLLATWFLAVIGVVLLPVLAIGAAATLPLWRRRRQPQPDGPPVIIDGTYEVIEPGR